MATSAVARPGIEETSGDENDREIIYSDVGLTPVHCKPPVVHQEQQPAGDSSVEAEFYSEEQISPQAAFEVFQGKIYNASVPPASTTSRFDAVRLNKSRDDDSPLERLARLQQEVAALETELKVATDPNSGRAFDEKVVKFATDLKNRLVTTSSACGEVDDLTRLIREQRHRIIERKGSAAVGSVNSVPKSGFVYELYGNAKNPTTVVEERLLNLERLLGNLQQPNTTSALSCSSSPSLLGKLDDIENLVATIDSDLLLKTAAKAKVIRADLEAASKARNKLTATYKKEDSKMIQQLYQQLIELDGLTSHLPTLVERLQQLNHLHRQASTFGTRLEELERGATQIEASVGQMEGSMEILQSTMAKNIAGMEQNLEKLEEKLNCF